jgi:hypothetical protein
VRSSVSPEGQKKVGFVLFDREKIGLSTGIIKIISAMVTWKTLGFLKNWPIGI